MGRRNEGATHLGICRRLVNFIFQTFRQVTPGRAPSARREETSSLMYDTSAFEEEDEAVLVPPVRTIPVEHRDTKKKSSIAMANLEEKPEGWTRPLSHDGRERQKRTIRLRSSSKDDKDKDITPKIIPFMGEKDDKTKGEEESFGLSKLPEKSEGAAVPLKPGGRSVSNIDTKFDTFIQDMRKSFEKLS